MGDAVHEPLFPILPIIQALFVPEDEYGPPRSASRVRASRISPRQDPSRAPIYEMSKNIRKKKEDREKILEGGDG